MTFHSPGESQDFIVTFVVNWTFLCPPADVQIVPGMKYQQLMEGKDSLCPAVYGLHYTGGDGDGLTLK